MGKKPYRVCPSGGVLVGKMFGKDFWLSELKTLVLTSCRVDQTRVCYTEESQMIKMFWNQMDEKFENSSKITLDHMAHRVNRLIVNLRHTLKLEWEEMGSPGVDDPR